MNKFKLKVLVFKRRLKGFFPSQKEKDQRLAGSIGIFYLLENKGDQKQTYNDINMLGITQVKQKGNKAYITLARPGILIGRKGENIDKLREFLKDEYKKDIEIFVKEDKVINWLYPIIDY